MVLAQAYVLETEGASGQSDDHGYAVVELPAVAYDGQHLTVQTLTVLPKIKARLKVRVWGSGGNSGVGEMRSSCAWEDERATV